MKRNYSILTLTPDEVEYLFYILKSDEGILEQLMGEFEKNKQYDLLDNAERHYHICESLIRRLD